MFSRSFNERVYGETRQALFPEQTLLPSLFAKFSGGSGSSLGRNKAETAEKVTQMRIPLILITVIWINWHVGFGQRMKSDGATDGINTNG